MSELCKHGRPYVAAPGCELCLNDVFHKAFMKSVKEVPDSRDEQIATLQARVRELEAELKKCEWKLGNATSNYMTLLTEPCIACEHNKHELNEATTRLAAQGKELVKLREAVQRIDDIAMTMGIGINLGDPAYRTKDHITSIMTVTRAALGE